MSAYFWLDEEIILEIQQRIQRRYGNAEGVRDANALASALARPINKYEYEDADLTTCAAAYAFGLAQNHPFVDGNKRIAYVAMTIFLMANGVLIAPDRDDATKLIFGVAAGEIDEDGIVAWLRDNWPDGEDAGSA